MERGYALFEKCGSWLVLAVFTTIGSGIWNGALIGAGWLLADNWERVEGFLGPVAKTVLALGVAFLTFLLVRRVLARRRALASGFDPAEADVDGNPAPDFDGLGSPNQYPAARGVARVDHR
ncbi:hypothetical protein ACQP2E_12945 [Actinoplanes sp. CA-015351]|uniref:hypothetical protein n=1 Tax=Actinoplanes sp. CA-015351 TaxID=3239897 RepID=UPI003D980E5B